MASRWFVDGLRFPPTAAKLDPYPARECSDSDGTKSYNRSNGESRRRCQMERGVAKSNAARNDSLGPRPGERPRRGFDEFPAIRGGAPAFVHASGARPP